MDSVIRIKGAKEHNLKNLNVSIPREKLVVVTGVSGSGKSSLAFDTLYAEGYRKYMDSLSVRTRQILDQVKRPEVDYIEGLSPVIAIEQRTGAVSSPRSTVATVTEIADYARLLWTVCGTPYCPDDGGRILPYSLDDCVNRIMGLPEGTRLQILAPCLKGKMALIREELDRLRFQGYQRIRLDGEVCQIDELKSFGRGAGEMILEIVIDRIVLRPDQRSRVSDSLELAFKEGKNQAILMTQLSRDAEWKEQVLAQSHACEVCGKLYKPVTPRHFSYSHPDGACSRCSGVGKTLEFVPELVVPDPTISVQKGAIKPWRLGSKKMIIRRNAILKQLAEQFPFDPTLPWEELDEAIQHAILYGTGDRLFSFKLRPGKSKPEFMPFLGVIEDLKNTQMHTSSDGLRARLTAYQVSSTCSLCQGQRLNEVSRNIKLGAAKKSYSEFMEMSLVDAYAFVRSLKTDKTLGLDDSQMGGSLLDLQEGLEKRLKFLNEVGIGYLTLNRGYDTLSGGEAQRVRLATQLGMGLVGVVYVLDEPSIGLHPQDTKRLLNCFYSLRDQGNSVIVVEHDESIIRHADYMLELGPGAGTQGGDLIFMGPPKESMKDPRSLTGPYLSGTCFIEKNSDERPVPKSFISILGAAHHNLKSIDVRIPHGLMTCVTGVSGSGKSSLINDILARYAANKLNRAKTIAGKHGGVYGLNDFRTVVIVDQKPIGQSPRSNPATYTKLFDLLRNLFAQCPLSKVRGYKASRFSFNMKGGRCERCQGDGMIKLDMHFLNDVYIECPSCEGRRYNRETLEIRYKGHSIADVLNMTVDDALELFQSHPKIFQKLQTLCDVGLGYLKLGQPANTLSGGEAQRIKLSLELSRKQQGDALFILDEPTTGLHWVDIQHLMDLLLRLRDAGNTIVIIEHDVDVIRCSDWIIDLGPGGGYEGGQLMYEGPMDGFKDSKNSITARFL